MNQENSILNSDPRAVLDSLNDGLYVTNRDRQIVYWGRSVERITGWEADDVLGKRCSDEVLCHIDKGRSSAVRRGALSPVPGHSDRERQHDTGDCIRPEQRWTPHPDAGQRCPRQRFGR